MRKALFKGRFKGVKKDVLYAQSLIVVIFIVVNCFRCFGHHEVAFRRKQEVILTVNLPDLFKTSKPSKKLQKNQHFQSSNFPKTHFDDKNNAPACAKYSPVIGTKGPGGQRDP